MKAEDLFHKSPWKYSGNIKQIYSVIIPYSIKEILNSGEWCADDFHSNFASSDFCIYHKESDALKVSIFPKNDNPLLKFPNDDFDISASPKEAWGMPKYVIFSSNQDAFIKKNLKTNQFTFNLADMAEYIHNFYASNQNFSSTLKNYIEHKDFREFEIQGLGSICNGYFKSTFGERVYNGFQEFNKSQISSLLFDYPSEMINILKETNLGYVFSPIKVNGKKADYSFKLDMRTDVSFDSLGLIKSPEELINLFNKFFKKTRLPNYSTAYIAKDSEINDWIKGWLRDRNNMQINCHSKHYTDQDSFKRIMPLVDEGFTAIEGEYDREMYFILGHDAIRKKPITL